MARSIRSTQLETRTGRLKLPLRWKPYAVRIAPGVRLGYRRKATAGSWSVIAADGRGGNWLKAFATADDFEDANDKEVLSFWQAQERARLLARDGGDPDHAISDTRPVTVAEALTRYTADLKMRGGDLGNVSRVRFHLPANLLKKPVALLTVDDLIRLKRSLNKAVSAGSVNRICNTAKAALNHAADADERIVGRPWKTALKSIPDAVVSRNVILPAEAIRRVVAEAYAVSDEFGLLAETAATTGARVGQLANLEVHDLQRDRLRLMMPSSKKGKGKKAITRRPVAIPESLATRLQQAARLKPKTAALLVKPSGEPWQKSDHSRLFRRAVKRAGLDPTEVTIYALRHSNIVRQLLANVPIRVVAVSHDTSVPMIEKTYSKFIGDHADALVRPALLDLSKLSGADNVVPLGRKS